MIVSIFTPTYNRAHLLPVLYESLCGQTLKEFEWIVVDDGSQDHTEQLIQNYIAAPKDFNIKYIKQPNQGKHLAINHGVQAASGILFFVVDSDDYLSPNAVARIYAAWKPIQDNPAFGGVVFNKCIIGGYTLGNPQYQRIDCRPLDFRYRFNEKGDKAEVIKTTIFKQYPFPNTVGEKFCPEGLFFNRIHHQLRYLNFDIYFCEYLPDGLTAQIFEVRRKSPVNTCLYYRELAESDIPWSKKIKAMLNFNRFERYVSENDEIASPNLPVLIRFVTKVVAKIIYLILDSRK